MMTKEETRHFLVLPIRVTGVPYSRAEMAVHFPVPFWPALSRIFGSRCVLSVSLNLRMFAVISIRKESNSVLFQSSKAWRRSHKINNACLKKPQKTTKQYQSIRMSSDRSPVPSRRGSFPGRPSSGDTPHKSAACPRTQCRCGPFSRNARRPRLRPAAPRPITVTRQDNKRTKPPDKWGVTHPIATGLSCSNLGGDALKDVFDVWPSKTPTRKQTDIFNCITHPVSPTGQVLNIHGLWSIRKPVEPHQASLCPPGMREGP